MSSSNDLVLVDKINGSAEPTKFKTLTLSANQFFARSSAGSATAFIITDLAFSLLDDTTTGAMQSTLGLVIGTNVQAFDQTLAALAAANWAANALPIGTGADTLSQTTFAANTFPARASTGNLVAKTITDFGLSLVDDANAAAAQSTLGLGTMCTQNANSVAITGGTINGTSVGATTPSSGAFNALTLTGVATTNSRIDSTAGDSRFLMSGNSATKAATLNFSNAFDTQGTLSIQRRTSADSFEASIVGVNLSTVSVWLGSGTIPAANPYSVTGQLFLAAGWGMQLNWNSNDVNSNAIVFGKIRSTSVVQSGDILGDVLFRGYDGTNYQSAALIRAVVDATPGSSDMPGALQFWVTADGTSSLTQRMTLKNSGVLCIAQNTDPGNGIVLAVTGNCQLGAGWHVYGGMVDSVVTNRGQGAYCTWNRHGGTGAMEFVNHKGGGVGGFFMTNTDGTTFTDLGVLDSNGHWKATNYGNALTDKGTVTTTVTLNWTTGTGVQRFQTTSATNITVSFTAPPNPCYMAIKIVAPAAGTTPTITWPTVKGGTMPATVTLAKTRYAFLMYDGTDYILTALSAEY